MNPAEQTATFCSVLLGDLAEASEHSLYANVWGRGPADTDKITAWRPVADIDAIIAAVREFDARPGFNTYLGMGVSRERLGQNRRIAAVNVNALTCVWVEIDIAGDAHAASNLPRTVEEARRVLDAIGVTPSMVWHSGHGLQAAWLLDEPWVFADAAERDEAAALMRDWRGSIAVHAHRIGRYRIDPVFDLSRVLRVPGTVNRKIVESRAEDGTVTRQVLDPVPCVLLECEPTRRYALDDLRAQMVDEAALAAFRGLPDVGGTADLEGVDLKAIWAVARSYAPNYEPAWMTAVLVDAPASLVNIWRDGHPAGDSEADAALTRHMAMLGAEPADAVEAIFCYRLRTGRKIEKVDPHQRRDYVIRTVKRFYEEHARSVAARVEAAEAATEALAAMEAEAKRRSAGPVADDENITTLADQAAHVLAHTSETVVPDGSLDSRPGDDIRAPLPAPPADEPAADVEPDEPADEPYDPEAAADAETAEEAAGGDPEPVVAHVDIPAPVLHDVVDQLAKREGPDSDGTGPGVLPPPNPWGVRTETQTSELNALSEMLINHEGVRVWRLLERGRGAKMERRLQLRLPTDHVWINGTPVGYRPGEPLHTGWWPAPSFNGVAGFLIALRQDAKLMTHRIEAQAFAERFSDTLVRLWEPDERSGSLASVAANGIANYLVAHAPSTSWAECAGSATPFARWDSRPRWDVDGEYSIWVRWADLCRYIRSQQAQPVTPQVSAELVEISGAAIVDSGEQAGQWYLLDRSFMPRWMWEAVMDAGRAAEQRREERNGLRVVGGTGGRGR